MDQVIVKPCALTSFLSDTTPSPVNHSPYTRALQESVCVCVCRPGKDVVLSCMRSCAGSGSSMQSSFISQLHNAIPSISSNHISTSGRPMDFTYRLNLIRGIFKILGIS